MEYITPQKACLELGICNKTLQRWRLQGKINYIKPGTRKYFYCTSEITGKTPEVKKIKKDFIYTRVSSIGQKSDLERQTNYLKELYPNHISISDVGSGLNFKRKGLKTILDAALQGTVGEVVVAHKDRLCRFGFEIIEYIINQQKGKIVVLNNDKDSPETELVHDLIAIITCFSARIHGLRSYKSKIKKDTNIPQ